MEMPLSGGLFRFRAGNCGRRTRGLRNFFQFFHRFNRLIPNIRYTKVTYWSAGAFLHIRNRCFTFAVNNSNHITESN